MKNKTLLENFSELNDVVKSYLDARINLWKVLLLEKITKTGTYFFSIVVSIVVIASLLLLLTFAFSFWYGNMYGNIYVGFLLSAGFYAVIGIILFLLRRPIFANNVVRNIGKILFVKDDEE